MQLTLFMDVYIYLIPLTLIITAIGVIALIWSVNARHYDDIDSIANRVLLDDERYKKD